MLPKNLLFFAFFFVHAIIPIENNEQANKRIVSSTSFGEINQSEIVASKKLVIYSDIKIGIYSGTFDPPTKAHNTIIRSAIETLGLRKLYIFVNKNGDKHYKCSSHERVEMLQRMLSDIKEQVVIIAQSSENKRSDYLMLKKILDDQKVIHIVGEDSYQRRLLLVPKKRVNFDAIAIIPRKLAHSEESIADKLESNAFYLPIGGAGSIELVSSTRTREKLAAHDYRNIDLTPEVLSYILEGSFYCAKDNGIEKKRLYIDKFYAYVGRRLSPCSPPAFDPNSSEDSWEEYFAKFFLEHKDLFF